MYRDVLTFYNIDFFSGVPHSSRFVFCIQTVAEATSEPPMGFSRTCKDEFFFSWVTFHRVSVALRCAQLV